MDRFPFWTRTASEGAGTTGCCFPTFAVYDWGDDKHCQFAPFKSPRPDEARKFHYCSGKSGTWEFWEQTAQPGSKRTRSKSCFLGELVFLAVERKQRERGKVIEQVDGRNRNRTDLSPSQLVPYSQQDLSSWSKAYPRNFGPIYAIFFLWLSFNNWDTRLTLVPLC